eukprot:CAMPEP_0203997262 /NCGR_PEP_ID=MMETSP0360-20130528/13280_1 /ASSEMBLY_ACC=CAM_ASM_000342 /TAXON_ID=268821 /ORGANISM="Scrippsiella Hangoei, Strain SHTV-5" /LENGTH=192 /DNA_ID=CAMNT_0050938179 /DNA_START=12 /DNA_END=588 /DNA_ORIENTATION=-
MSTSSFVGVACGDSGAAEEDNRPATDTAAATAESGSWRGLRLHGSCALGALSQHRMQDLRIGWRQDIELHQQSGASMSSVSGSGSSFAVGVGSGAGSLTLHGEPALSSVYSFDILSFSSGPCSETTFCSLFPLLVDCHLRSAQQMILVNSVKKSIAEENVELFQGSRRFGPAQPTLQVGAQNPRCLSLLGLE